MQTLLVRDADGLTDWSKSRELIADALADPVEAAAQHRERLLTGPQALAAQQSWDD